MKIILNINRCIVHCNYHKILSTCQVHKITRQRVLCSYYNRKKKKEIEKHFFG